MFWCPGCECAHGIWTDEDPNQIPSDHWTITGLPEKPTIVPSILSSGMLRCHLFVRDGKIEFLDECEHALAGKTVDMVPFPL